MSYILDALKKIEREKIKKSRSGGTTSISGELFREERSRPARGGAWKIIVVAVITSCVAMAATWLYLRPDKFSKRAARRSVSPAASTASGTVPAAPATQLPVQPPVQPPLAMPAQAPVQSAIPAPPLQKSPIPHPPAVPVPVASAPATQPAPRKTDSSRKERSMQPAPVLPEQRSAVATIVPPADIKVSGIAWQEERSARRAVVNGFLMKEGSVVSGARVIEILQDRVRFSTSGGEFELSMVASGIPGASK